MIIWCPYRWEISNVFDSPEGLTTPLRKYPSDRHAPVGGREQPARAVSFVVDWFFSTEDALAGTLSFDGNPYLAPGRHGVKLRGHAPTSYINDDDDAYDLGVSANVSVDSHVDVSAGTSQGFGAIHVLRHFANVPMPENANGMFSLAL